MASMSLSTVASRRNGTISLSSSRATMRFVPVARPFRTPGKQRHNAVPKNVPGLDVAICGEDEGCLVEHWLEAFRASGNAKRKFVVGGNWKSNGTLVSR